MKRKMEQETVRKKGNIDEKPSFFKIMFPFPQISKILQIPPEFIQHISKSAFEKATFIDRFGHSWLVKFQENKNGIFVKDGWDRFFHAHSLGHNEIVMFVYDGERCFHVDIFGNDGLERVPTPDDAKFGSMSLDHCSEDENNEEAIPLNESRKRGRSRKNPPSHLQHLFPPHRKGQDIPRLGSRELKQLGATKSSKKSNEKQVIKSSDEKIALRLKDIEDKMVYQNETNEVAIPLNERRKRGRPRKDPLFNLQQPFPPQRKGQDIPRLGWRELKQLGAMKSSKKSNERQIIESSCEKIALRFKNIEDEKVYQSIKDKNASTKASDTKLEDKKRKRGKPVGAIKRNKRYSKKRKERKCPNMEIKEEIIEEIKEEIIEVSVEESGIGSKKFNGREVKNGIYSRKDALCSRFPFFEKCIDMDNVNMPYMTGIPKTFAEKYLPDTHMAMVLTNDNGTSWTVNFVPTPSAPRFCGGWVRFMRDNKLKLGDRCIFELVKEKEMKIFIWRKV